MSLTLRLDPELDNQLGHAAVDAKTTKTDLIAKAVSAMLERREEPIMSDLTRALRKAEDELTYALVEETEAGTPNPRLAGFHDSAKQLIILLRAMASAMEAWENDECVGGNMGHYASGVGPWND